MTFEEALAQELKTISALNNRVYPLTAPEQRFDLSQPYLIYLSSEGLRDKSMEGYMTSKEVRGELNVAAKRYIDMKSITSSVIELLISMGGREIGTGGPHIAELTYEMPVELYESQPNLYRCLIDFTAYFETGG